MRPNSFMPSAPDRGFRYLSEDQLKTIHYATVRILEETGVHIMSEEGREILRNAGCRVKGSTVYIPQSLLEKCIASAPGAISFYGRNDDHGVHLQGRNVYFCTGGNMMYTIDYQTGERRLATQKDVEEAAVLYDYLPNLDMAYNMATINDVPEPIRHVQQFYSLVTNTNKPICNAVYDLEQVKVIVEMGIAIRGSLEELQRRPLFFCTAPATAPLQLCKESVDRLIYCADMKIPIACNVGLMAGGTSPVTLAGTLAQSTAESLSSLVVNQVRNPGAPVLFGGVMAIQDMSTAGMCFAAPEANILHGAQAELAHYYDLPNWGTGACSESKVVDQQAAIESTLSAMSMLLTGAGIVHGTAYMDGSLCGSFESLVMNDEIIGAAKTMLAGIPINDETLALDVIQEVGPGGLFLTEEHTAEHCRKRFIPTLFDRRNYVEWQEDGAKTMGDRVREKIAHILANHKPEPMNEDALREITRIMERTRTNAGC